MFAVKARQLKARVCVQARGHWQLCDFHGEAGGLRLVQSACVARECGFDVDAVLAVAGDFDALAYCLHPDSLAVVQLPTLDMRCARQLAEHMLPLSADKGRVHWRRGREAIAAYCLPEAGVLALEEQLAAKSVALLGVSDYASVLLSLVPRRQRAYYYADDVLVYVDSSAGSVDCDYPLGVDVARAAIAGLGADVHLCESLDEGSRLLPPPQVWQQDVALYYVNLLGVAMVLPAWPRKRP